jgi:hypothetical protein
MIVIIKPRKKSNYKNVVDDILDEMAITGVPTYTIVNDTPAELKLLEGK